MSLAAPQIEELLKKAKSTIVHLTMNPILV